MTTETTKKTETIETALMVLDNARITEALTVPSAMEILLTEIKAKADGFEGSLETATSRKEMASYAYKFAQTKTAVDAYGKSYLAEVKAKVKVIDGARKQLRDTCDECRDSVRAPLNAWEAERSTAVASLEKIKDAGDEPGETVDEITKTIARFQILDVSKFPEDMQEEVRQAADEAQIKATKALAVAEKMAADAAELERLRKVEADATAEADKERIEREAVERARVAADAKVQREADDARSKAVAAEARAANAEAEANARVAREKVAEENAKAQREADDAHVAQILNVAYKCLCEVYGMTPEASVNVTKAIHAGLIRNVSINI